MLQKVNEVLDAFQVEDRKSCIIPIFTKKRGKKKRMGYFVYPALVRNALRCLWNIEKCREILATGTFEMAKYYIKEQDYKVIFFRSAIHEYKKFLPLYEEWKEKNF